jgi:AcrR family transcriptional regulator
MLIGHSMCDISEAVGVDRRTLYRWRKEEAFAEALAQRREEIWSGAAERLVSLVDPAIDVLQRQLRDRHDRSRFRAAAAILRLVDVRKAMSPRNL